MEYFGNNGDESNLSYVVSASEFVPPSRLGSTTTFSYPKNSATGTVSSIAPAKYVSTSSFSSINNRNFLGNSPSISPPKTASESSTTNVSYSAGIHQENVGGTTYFYAQEQTRAATYEEDPIVPYPITPGHAYTTPSHLTDLKQNNYQSSVFFMAEDLRDSIIIKNELSNSNDLESQNLPLEVDNFHSLSLLDTSNLPVPTSSTYKATHCLTGLKYCLRRLHGFRVQSVKTMMQVVDTWKQFGHPNCIKLREVFTTKAFGDNSLILVYDLHLGTQTLLAKYFTPISNGYSSSSGTAFSGDARPFSHSQRTANGPMLQENDIWNIIIQLTCGLRAIHQANLACRSLDPSKIVVDGKRIRFSFLGLTDIIANDPNQPNPLQLVNHYQQDDLTALGKLIVALSCRSLQSAHRDQIQLSIDLISRNYSSDLKNLITYLLSANKLKSIVDVMPKIGARFYTHLELLENQSDVIENELLKEIENGRLYRLLVKLGTINERELSMDSQWSETGNRYMLKLFRDYLFHSVTEDGCPWMDMSHIVSTLNKLDAGTLEKVQLMSRDEQSVLVLTYAELKQCFSEAFNELSYTM